MKIIIGAFYICTCTFESCTRYYQALGIDHRYGKLNVLNCEGKEEGFWVDEAERLLVPVAVYNSPLFKALT